jgi:AcrR family transcriptional regulator
MATSARRRRPGPRRAFSRDELLDTAERLLDDGGPNAASIRGIARTVGVAPNAVYTYFADKAAVVNALAERLLARVDHGVFADASQPWRQRVESLALELRTRLTAHPGAASLMIEAPMDGPHARLLTERLLGLFADAGLDPIEAARACHLLTVYVFGSVTLEVTDPHQPGPLPSESDRITARHRTLAAVPPDRYPHTAAAAATLADAVSTEQYLWGLTRVLDAIAATIQPPPA